jgi:hypothetical protein
MTPTKPIILSKDELRAALDGTLTEVRRKVPANKVWKWVGRHDSMASAAPYPTGTRLWVKEGYCAHWCAGMFVGPDPCRTITDGSMVHQNDGGAVPATADNPIRVWYRATAAGLPFAHSAWKKSTQMPVWASRLTLTVESVAVSNDGGTWWWVYGVNVERKDER